MKSTAVWWTTKIKIYTIIIKPVLFCGSENYTLSRHCEHLLIVFENEMLRQIFGRINDNGYTELTYTVYTEIRDL